MGQGSSTQHGDKAARASATPGAPSDTMEHIAPPRTRPFPIDIQGGPRRNNESPVFFGSPLNSPIDSGFHADRGRQAMQAPPPTTHSGKVPTVFRWTHGGHNVYITGTFNNWKERIPLNRSQEEFTTIIDLPEGVHQYKFIVDDEWRYNPDLPTMPDRSGAVNNFLEVTNQDDGFEFEDIVSTPNIAASPPGLYSQEVPTLDSTTKPPPVLPPHLMQVLLNCEPVSQEDPTLLPIPNHVMLNHLYALSISDGVMVMGATNRYNQKYVTTILYRPVFDE